MNIRHSRTAPSRRLYSPMIVIATILAALAASGPAVAAPDGADGIVFESRAPGANIGGGLSVSANINGHTFRLRERTTVTGIGMHASAFSNQTIYAGIYKLGTPWSTPDAVGESNLLGTTLLNVPVGGPTQISAPLSMTLEPGWYAVMTGTGRHGATAPTFGVTITPVDTPTTPNSIGPYSINATTNARVFQGTSTRYFVTGETLPPQPPSPTEFLMESARPSAMWNNAGYELSSTVFRGTRFTVDRTARIGRVGAWMMNGTGQMFAAIVRLSAPGAPLPPVGSTAFNNNLVATTLIDVGSAADEYTADFGGVELQPGAYALVLGSGMFGATGSAHIIGLQDEVVIPDGLVWTGSWWANGPPYFRMFLSGIVPELDVENDPTAFGVVPVGLTETRTLTISNRRDGNLQLEGIGITGDGLLQFALSEDSGACSTALLPAGGSCTFTVDYTPAETGDHSALLQVFSDGVPDTFAVELTGRGIPAYIVTPSAGANGAIAPDTPQVVGEGFARSFTLTPDVGHHIAGVGGSCGGTLNGNAYTTAAVTADCAVEASFAIDTFTVTPNIGSHGSIVPAMPQIADYGSSVSFTITSDPGYHIDQVAGCGGSLDGNVYTTGAVTANCTISVSFAIDPATAIAIVGGTPQSTVVGTAFAEPLRVRLSNEAGLGVPGVIVGYTSPSTGAGAMLTAVVTGEDGIASVTPVANTVAGSYVIETIVAGIAETATFQLTNLAGPAAQVQAVQGGGQSATVSTAFAQPLVVRVTDAHANPVEGAAVSFAAPASGAGAVLSAGSVDTGSDGTASVTATANAIVGHYAVNASVAGVGTAGSFALENTARDVVLGIAIDDGLDHAAYGQTLDYLVTVHNNGTHVANGIDIATVLPEQLDAAAATWICLDAGSGACSASGTGTLVDDDAVVPASGSIRYVLTVPVRPDAPGGAIEVEAMAIGPYESETASAGDSTQLILFRDGFETETDALEHLIRETLSSGR